MPDAKIPYWHWRVLGKTRTGRDSWRTLRWTMTEEDAASWAAVNGKTIGSTMEKAPGAPEMRWHSDEPYIGWGQALWTAPGRLTDDKQPHMTEDHNRIAGDEMQAARDRLERDIESLISMFEARTGANVASVSFSATDPVVRIRVKGAPGLHSVT